MGVRRGSKHEVIEVLRRGYHGAGRMAKARLIDEAVAVTGYDRRYAQRLLRGGTPYHGPRLRRVGRARHYGPEVTRALEVAAEATGWICGKRRAPFLPELIPALEREGALRLDDAGRAAVCAVSAATIDRRLTESRRQHKPRGLVTTKPGSVLKSQIPSRTYTPWDEEEPGFVEIDLVAPCGTSTAGAYAYTLDAVDVATGWTECAALPNKSQSAVVAALSALRVRFPFPVRGIDSDNGSEFINALLVGYGETAQLTFTRCRAYHKNDQAHVEEKNWAVVRQLIGYDRYEEADAVTQLDHIYGLLHVYVNGYLPVMKLVGKERAGARVRKRYDTPRTPYRRADEAAVLDAPAATAFATLRDHTGPLALRHQIDAASADLWEHRVRPTTARQSACSGYGAPGLAGSRAGRGSAMVRGHRAGRASPNPHLLDAEAGLIAFAFRAADVAVGGDQPTLPTDHGLTLAAGRTCEAPVLNRHRPSYMLRPFYSNTSVTYGAGARTWSCGYLRSGIHNSLSRRRPGQDQDTSLENVHPYMRQRLTQKHFYL